MVYMNSTNTVQTGHYHDFRPYQVDVENLPKSAKGRESKIFTPEVLTLLSRNVGQWFVIQEYKFGKEQKKEIASKRSTYYQSSKSHILKYPNLEYLVRGESNTQDTHTLRLIARFADENQ